MTAIANGHAPADSDTPDLLAVFQEHEEEMRDGMRDLVVSAQMLLRDASKHRTQLEALLDESKQRERRLAKVISDLTGESATTAKKQQQSAADRDKHDWTPSEERIEAIKRAFFEFAEQQGDGAPFTQTEVARFMKESNRGVSSETIAKAVVILRDREVLRAAGKTRGGGTLWAPMRAANGEA